MESPTAIYDSVVAWIAASVVAGLFAWAYLRNRPRTARITGTLTSVMVVFSVLGLGVSYLIFAASKHDPDADAVTAIAHSLELDKVSADNPDLREKILSALLQEATTQALTPSIVHQAFVNLVAPVAVKAPRENIIRYGTALRDLVAVLAQTTPDTCMQYLSGSYADVPPQVVAPHINALGQAISAAYQNGRDHPSPTIASAADVISAEDAAEIGERVYALPTNPFTEDEIKHAKDATGEPGERCLLELKFYTNLLNMSEDDQDNLLRAILAQ